MRTSLNLLSKTKYFFILIICYAFILIKTIIFTFLMGIFLADINVLLNGLVNESFVYLDK